VIDHRQHTLLTFDFLKIRITGDQIIPMNYFRFIEEGTTMISSSPENTKKAIDTINKDNNAATSPNSPKQSKSSGTLTTGMTALSPDFQPGNQDGKLYTFT
jgi:hypothetical protein